VYISKAVLGFADQSLKTGANINSLIALVAGRHGMRNASPKIRV
jgi:hypothetical protein